VGGSIIERRTVGEGRNGTDTNPTPNMSFGGLEEMPIGFGLCKERAVDSVWVADFEFDLVSLGLAFDGAFPVWDEPCIMVDAVG